MQTVLQHEPAQAFTPIGLIQNREVVHVERAVGCTFDKDSGIEVPAPDDAIFIFVWRLQKHTPKVLLGIKAVHVMGHMQQPESTWRTDFPTSIG